VTPRRDNARPAGKVPCEPPISAACDDLAFAPVNGTRIAANLPEHQALGPALAEERVGPAGLRPIGPDRSEAGEGLIKTSVLVFDEGRQFQYTRPGLPVGYDVAVIGRIQQGQVEIAV